MCLETMRYNIARIMSNDNIIIAMIDKFPSYTISGDNEYVVDTCAHTRGVKSN